MKYAKVLASTYVRYRSHRFAPLNTEQVTPDVQFNQQMENQFEQGYQQGIDQGREQGMLEGRQQGLEEGRIQGHQQGMTQGLKEGQARGEQALQAAVGRLGDIQQQVENYSQEQIASQKQLICDLVAQVARQVIRTELSQQPEQILKLTEEAIAGTVGDKEKLSIYLNPADKARLHSLGLDKLNDWELLTDENIALGDSSIRSADVEVALNHENRLQDGIESLRVSMG